MFVHALTIRTMIAIALPTRGFTHNDLFEFGIGNGRDPYGLNVDTRCYLRQIIWFLLQSLRFWFGLARIPERDPKRSWTKA